SSTDMSAARIADAETVHASTTQLKRHAGRVIDDSPLEHCWCSTPRSAGDVQCTKRPFQNPSPAPSPKRGGESQVFLPSPVGGGGWGGVWDQPLSGRA